MQELSKSIKDRILTWCSETSDCNVCEFGEIYCVRPSILYSQVNEYWEEYLKEIAIDEMDFS